jgi:hypothetical protein
MDNPWVVLGWAGLGWAKNFYWTKVLSWVGLGCQVFRLYWVAFEKSDQHPSLLVPTRRAKISYVARRPYSSHSLVSRDVRWLDHSMGCVGLGRKFLLNHGVWLGWLWMSQVELAFTLLENLMVELSCKFCWLGLKKVTHVHVWCVCLTDYFVFTSAWFDFIAVICASFYRPITCNAARYLNVWFSLSLLY